jgi:uncharacterized protein (TIGR01370 family)
VLNSAQRDLKTIRSWAFVQAAGDIPWPARNDFPLQAVDESQYRYEMMVTELRPGPGPDKEYWSDAFLHADNIRSWQNSSAQGKVLLAYIDLPSLGGDHPLNGVAMSARAHWIDAAGQPTANAPFWLLCSNSIYSKLNWVAYWHPEWKRHIVAEIDHAITIGANGVFLDAVTAGTWILGVANPGCASGKANGIDLKYEMKRFVQEIKAYVISRKLDRLFHVVISDGRGVYDAYPDLFDHIDGVVGDYLYFTGWDLPGGMNGPEQEWRTRESDRYVTALNAAAIPMFGIENITDPAKIKRLGELAATRCFLPSVSEQFLPLVSKPRNQIYCDDTHCTNNDEFLTARDLSKCPRPQVALASNGRDFSSGERIAVTIESSNPVEGRPMELYVGALWPDGRTIAFLTGPDTWGGLGDYAAPASVAPMMTLKPGATLRKEVLTYTFPSSGIPAGTYTVFAALFRQGSIADNTLDGGDLVSLDYFPLTYAP